jgi:hypothetical protein
MQGTVSAAALRECLDVQPITLNTILFADDVLLARTEDNLQTAFQQLKYTKISLSLRNIPEK